MAKIFNKIKKRLAVFSDFGFWFLFFVVLYLILLFKISTTSFVGGVTFFKFYSILIFIYIISRFFLAYFHRSIKHDEGYQPSITFVVPAKNEEDNVAETIRRFLHADYPKEKIEIIAINDGSTDSTYAEMLKIKKEIGQEIPVTVVNWKVNRGKRAGMAEGVRRANHEIVIFIDSDSFIAPDCVKHLVKYFSNPRVGAVSGHTDVFNRDTNLLTQMQATRYFIAFSVYKAAESVFGNVTCCPGCCSAYRREYLLEFIDVWLNQRFLGSECTFGDDRSLTNFIIRKYEAVYSPEAKAHTVVPDTLGKYIKQQQRWKKSWIRETLIASAFMWRKNFFAALSYYSYVILALSAPIVFIRAVIWHPYLTGSIPLAYLAGLFLMLLLHGIYYRTQVGPRAWFLSVMTFWFYTVMLMWQLPWAMITIRDSRWGTR
ncbi:MAG: glycosyltransferase family 2 protein [Patescibacteria group bacterium]